MLANYRRRCCIPLPSASPHQSPQMLPRLPSCRIEYLLLCVRSITHYLFHLHLHFARANVNNNKRAALQSRLTRNVGALSTTTLRCKVFFLCTLSLCCTPATATTAAAMDLFVFYPPSGVLICKPCGYAIPPTTLSTHIKVHHIYDARHAATNLFNAPQARNPATLLANYLCERYEVLDPAIAKVPTPPATNLPIPELKLHRGYQCTRCSFVLRSQGKQAKTSIRTHFNVHHLVPRKPGQQAKIAGIPAIDSEPMFAEVFCQRFFASGAQSSFFTVNVLD